MKKFSKLLLTAGALLALSPASGQSAAQYDEQLQALQEETAMIKNKLFSMPAVSGFINLPFEYTHTDEGGTSASSFAVKRARLKVSGGIGSKFDYCMQADFASSPRLMDAFVNYKPFTWLGFKLGQSKTIFSMDNKVFVPLRLETIDNPMSVAAFTGQSGDLQGHSSSTGRDIGLTAYGAALQRDGYSILEYAVAVYNGAGINTKDNNHSKDVALALDITPVKSFTIAASALFGQYGADYLHRDRYSIGARWEDENILVRGEYLYGDSGSAAGTFKSQGGYVSASCRVCPGLRPVVRYDVIQRNLNDKTLSSEYLAGLDWWFYKKNLRLQANYTFCDYGTSGQKNMHKVALMLTAAF